MQLGIVAAFDREVQMLVGRTGSMADLQGQMLVMVAGMGAERARGR